jgi:two-component system cell cycle response regulator
VGNPQIVSECKGFEDTKNWQFHESIADAKASLSRSAVPATAAAGAA